MLITDTRILDGRSERRFDYGLFAARGTSLRFTFSRFKVALLQRRLLLQICILALLPLLLDLFMYLKC